MRWRFNKTLLSPFVYLIFISCRVSKASENLSKTAWNSGSENCKVNTDPPLQLVQFNNNTWILRQNKCINYEAPFLYLFIGNKKALLMDTGATADEQQFPLYATIKKIIDQWEKNTSSHIELIVAHTHAHGDHIAADNQFKNKANTTIVELQADKVKSFFKIKDWPFESGTLDLGNRVVEIIPIPGHQDASIAVYDYKTKILLTGDSFYPGRLYIKDWQSFKASIQRLTDFTSKHKISYILGNHIEMTKIPAEDYPTGTTFQPSEHALPLKVKDLQLLNNSLKRLGSNPQYERHDNFIIYPLKVK